MPVVFVYGDGTIKLGDFGKSGPFGSNAGCDVRADFRCLGLLLIRAITGKPSLIKHGVPRPLPATTPDDLCQLLGALLAENLSSADALRALLRSDAEAIANAEEIIAWMRVEEAPVPSDVRPASERAADARDAPSGTRRRWYAALAAAAVIGALAGYELSPRATRVSESPFAESPSREPESPRVADEGAQDDDDVAQDDDEDADDVFADMAPRTEQTGPEAQTRSDRDGAVERRADPINERMKNLIVPTTQKETPKDNIAPSRRSRNQDGIGAVITNRRQWLANGDVRVGFYIDNDNEHEYRLALVRLIDGQLQPVASVRVERFSPRVERRDPFVGVIPAGAMSHGVLRLSHVRARAGQSLTLWLSEADGERPIIVNLTW